MHKHGKNKAQTDWTFRINYCSAVAILRFLQELIEEEI